jgi:hypothetical protein
MQGRPTVQVSTVNEGGCLRLAKRQLRGGVITAGYVTYLARLQILAAK